MKILCVNLVYLQTFPVIPFIFFSNGSTALVGLGLLYEFPLSHTVRRAKLGMTSLDK